MARKPSHLTSYSQSAPLKGSSTRVASMGRMARGMGAFAAPLTVARASEVFLDAATGFRLSAFGSFGFAFERAAVFFTGRALANVAVAAGFCRSPMADGRDPLPSRLPLAATFLSVSASQAFLPFAAAAARLLCHSA